MRKLLIPLFISIMVSMLMTIPTYAYYDTLSNTKNISISIRAYNEWDINEDYHKGDIVYYEGNLYIATKNNVPFWVNPTSHIGWVFWDLI